MNTQTIRRARLAQLIKDHYDGSQARFVEVTGENQGEVSALLRDKSFGEKKARKIELKCKLPHGWLDLPIDASSEDVNLRPDPAKAIPAGRWMEITGIAQGKPDGLLNIEPCPPGENDWLIYSFSTDNDAYSLRVRGDNMRPRLKHAEYIIAEPGNAALPGDDVIVKLTDGRELIKELLWIRDDEIYLGSINNGSPPMTVQQSEIGYIHRISAIVTRSSPLLRRDGKDAV
jgi:phage repressor protein C with HTH and peptisase S24 domain